MAGIPLPGEKAIQLIRELKRNETEIIPYEVRKALKSGRGRGRGRGDAEH
jgi:hypothetical protein